MIVLYAENLFCSREPCPSMQNRCQNGFKLPDRLQSQYKSALISLMTTTFAKNDKNNKNTQLIIQCVYKLLGYLRRKRRRPNNNWTNKILFLFIQRINTIELNWSRLNHSIKFFCCFCLLLLLLLLLTLVLHRIVCVHQ